MTRAGSTPSEPAEGPVALVLVGDDPVAGTGIAAGALSAHADLVVAVDSGLHVAERSGRPPHLVVGDMDSVDPSALDRARAGGAEVRTHPVDKDHTDLELALLEVAARGCRRAIVVGGSGGRMDHLLGGALTLCAPEHAGIGIEAWWGTSRLLPVHGRRVLRVAPGTTLSLVAVNGAADGVRTEGLRFPLRGERLGPGSSRGISNVAESEHVAVSVESGAVLIIVPDEEASP